MNKKKKEHPDFSQHALTSCFWNNSQVKVDLGAVTALNSSSQFL